jgi:parallel beta-helix repeat protein
VIKGISIREKIQIQIGRQLRCPLLLAEPKTFGRLAKLSKSFTKAIDLRLRQFKLSDLAFRAFKAFGKRKEWPDSNKEAIKPTIEKAPMSPKFHLVTSSIKSRPSFLVATFVLPNLFLLFWATATHAQVIYENDFDHRVAGLYAESDLDADWNSPDFTNGVTEGRVSIVEGEEAFGGTGSSLAVSYPAGQHGASETGAQWPFEFDAEFEEVTLSYRVKFKNGFDFVRGGKLPGLAGGTAPTGNAPADGFNGWTGRMMWRTDFEGVAGSPVQSLTNGISYAKYTDSGFNEDGRDEDNEYWNDSNGVRTTLVAGQWYQIIQRIKMNDPELDNGILQIRIDGNLVLDQQNIRFRLTDQIAIDQMYFSTFFGGNEDWATSKDEVVYFDDFVITQPDPAFFKVPEDFPSIQSAIDVARPGDTVAVRGGHRENIVVDKAILLRGYQGTYVVAADDDEPVMKVTASNVHLKRFQILRGSVGVFVQPRNTNVKMESLAIRYANVGINLKEDCDGAWISKCVLLRNGSDGLCVLESDQIEIVSNKSYLNEENGFNLINVNNAELFGNTAYLSSEEGFVLTGSGHVATRNRALNNVGSGFLVKQNGHVLMDNLSRSNRSHGYVLEEATDCNVVDNEAQFNRADGFRLTMLSSSNLVDDNGSRLNLGNGSLLDFSQSNQISNNYIYANKMSGLVLTETTSDNTVTQNVVRSSRLYGILDDGEGNEVADNVERYNGM